LKFYFIGFEISEGYEQGDVLIEAEA